MLTWYRTHRLHAMIMATAGLAAFGVTRFWQHLDSLTLTILIGAAIGLMVNGIRALRSGQPEAIRQAQMACALYCIMAFGIVKAALR